MQTSLRTPLQQEPGHHHDSVQRKTDGMEAGLGQLGFEDRRPMAVAQRKLSELMDGSPRVLQQKSIADGMGVAPQMLQQKAQMEKIQKSARGVGFGLGPVQRREGDSLEEDLASEHASEEEILQGKFVGETPTQLAEAPEPVAKPNNTGLPDQLKAGIESLSGMSMDHVRVHYNSDKPAQLQAHAYAQGSEIHIGPGQEKHLAHEAWHVVQQAQGRVRATRQMKGGG